MLIKRVAKYISALRSFISDGRQFTLPNLFALFDPLVKVVRYEDLVKLKDCLQKRLTYPRGLSITRILQKLYLHSPPAVLLKR